MVLINMTVKECTNRIHVKSTNFEKYSSNLVFIFIYMSVFSKFVILVVLYNTTTKTKTADEF